MIDHSTRKSTLPLGSEWVCETLKSRVTRKIGRESHSARHCSCGGMTRLRASESWWEVRHFKERCTSSWRGFTKMRKGNLAFLMRCGWENGSGIHWYVANIYWLFTDQISHNHLVHPGGTNLRMERQLLLLSLVQIRPSYQYFPVTSRPTQFIWLSEISTSLHIRSHQSELQSYWAIYQSQNLNQFTGEAFTGWLPDFS